MGCVIEFVESFARIEFCSKGNKQKILIDVLLKYSAIDVDTLALVLNVTAKKLQNICDGKGFLVGESADSLAQLFLIFFGRQFFRKFTLVRSFLS